MSAFTTAKQDAAKILKLERRIAAVKKTAEDKSAVLQTEIDAIQKQYANMDGGTGLLAAALEHVRETTAYKSGMAEGA
jgi:hypothetical protein